LEKKQRLEKAKAQESLREKMRSAKSIVFVEFRGLTVADDTRFRRTCRDSRVEYKVVKNTLASRAASDLGWQGLSEVFQGPTAMAVSETDAVAAARVVTGFAREVPAIRIKGGVLEGGEVLTPERVAFLGTLPPKEVLVARLVGAMQSPVASFVTVLSGTISGFARAVNALREKKERAAD
jgi:large subunit ribosomal protein L10